MVYLYIILIYVYKSRSKTRRKHDAVVSHPTMFIQTHTLVTAAKTTSWQFSSFFFASVYFSLLPVTHPHQRIQTICRNNLLERDICLSRTNCAWPSEKAENSFTQCIILESHSLYNDMLGYWKNSWSTWKTKRK